mmetsp:Transcript_17179/g.31131  ORF Transcript_17179/g.31131 Transcript_17179/m.31131 type:complete len:275 (-) Transcript_17179:189-1013(-)
MPESLAATKSAAASTSGSQQSQACSAAAATSVAASSTTPSAAASATAAPKVSQPQSAAMATAQPTATTHAQKPVATINGTAITTNNNINGSTNSAIPPQQPPRKSAESPKRNTCPNSTTCSWNFANSNDNSSALPSTLRPTPTTTTIQKLPRLPGRRNGGKSFMGLYCILRIRYGRLRRGACWRSRRGRRNGNNTNNNCWMRRLRLAMIHNNQMTTNHNHCQQINSPPPKPPSPTSHPHHPRPPRERSPTPPNDASSTRASPPARLSCHRPSMP